MAPGVLLKDQGKTYAVRPGFIDRSGLILVWEQRVADFQGWSLPISTLTLVTSMSLFLVEKCSRHNTGHPEETAQGWGCSLFIFYSHCLASFLM